MKLATVIDQAKDGEIAYMAADAWKVCTDRYHVKMGGPPPQGEEVTKEQLTALNSLYQGSGPPYADFAIFGPYGNRIQRQVKLSGLALGPKGTLVPMVLTGPASFDDWKESYLCFRTGSIVFQPHLIIQPLYYSIE